VKRTCLRHELGEVGPEAQRYQILMFRYVRVD
jgi:hypothetical protein